LALVVLGGLAVLVTEAEVATLLLVHYLVRSVGKGATTPGNQSMAAAIFHQISITRNLLFLGAVRVCPVQVEVLMLAAAAAVH
jgi:hypothetical protein